MGMIFIMKFILSIMCGLSFFFDFIDALETSEDEQYIYTKQSWNEIVATDQRLLMQYFDEKLTQFLKNWDLPSSWNAHIEELLLGQQDRYDTIMGETNDRSGDFAASNNISLEDLIPTGFIVGFGLNYSEDVVLGIGGSALMTLIVVPLKVQQVDKVTGETSVYYEASWGIGGFAQQGIGAGVGGEISTHGAIGIIWGPLPDATILQGPAVGISADIAKVAGLGFKAALIFNSITNEKNVIALVTYNVGAAVDADVQPSVFYFISAEEVFKSLKLVESWNTNGVETITYAQLHP
jgi:hypothetical protein